MEEQAHSVQLQEFTFQLTCTEIRCLKESQTRLILIQLYNYNSIATITTLLYSILIIPMLCYVIFHSIQTLVVAVFQLNIEGNQMGNLSYLSVEQNQQFTNLKLDMDFKKPILDQHKQLTKWSLEQIRQIYVPFRKRKGSPVMSRSQFLRFIRLSRITSFFIFDKIRQTAPINVFEVLALLTLTAYAHINHKVQFLFNLFDLAGSKQIHFRELVLLFTSLIRGFAILTGQALPEHGHLQKYAETLFSRADLNNDQNLQLGEVLGWFQSHAEGISLFNIFEPCLLGKQSYHIFSGYPPYTQTQVDLIFQRLNKVYHNQQLYEQDFKILTRARKSSKPKYDKQNMFSDSSFFHNLAKNVSLKTNLPQPFETPKNRQTLHGWGTHSTQDFHTQSKYKMPKIAPSKQKTERQFSKLHQKNSQLAHMDCLNKKVFHQSKLFKKSFSNIIIIKGKTITKKEVFDLRDYFDKISNGKKTILIEDFLESFNQEKYNHMKSVAASLYNFLDKKKIGKVNFIQLVLKLYPDLTKQHVKLIQNWSQQYSSNFNLDKKIKDNRQQEQHKKRLLPKSCVPRFREIYLLFDKNRKGYVTFQDLKRVLADVSTEKQLIQTFQDCDKDKDGKLSFQQFSHILLPPDLQIQGLQ